MKERAFDGVQQYLEFSENDIQYQLDIFQGNIFGGWFPTADGGREDSIPF